MSNDSTAAKYSRRRFLGGAAAGVAATAGVGRMTGAKPVMNETSGPVALSTPKAISELDTPALLIDLEALQHNLEKMALHAQRSGIGLRPHATARATQPRMWPWRGTPPT